MQPFRRQCGQTMSEYALVLAIITPFIVAAFAILGAAVTGRLDFVANLL